MAEKHHFSTADLPGRESVDAWRHAMAEVYYRLDIKTQQHERLNGELSDVQFDSLGISKFKADAQRVIRRKEAAKVDNAENFVFLFPTRKKMQFEQRGQIGMASPGEVFLLNSAEDYVVDVPDGSENITIKIDRRVLIDRVKGIDDLCAGANIANSCLVPAVATLGAQVLMLPEGEQSGRLQQAVIDMICLMLDLRGRTPNAAYRRGEARHDRSLVRKTLTDSIFGQLVSYVIQHMHEHDLSPEQAACDHRISVRYLHKIFHDHGTSFGRHLMETRLKHAYHLISNNCRAGSVNFGEVAQQCGFASQSHFSCCYKKRFGVTPRRTASANHAVNTAGAYPGMDAHEGPA